MTPRLLVVRLGSMGDLVHALPAVAALRKTFPEAQLDWVVEARWRELVERVPGVSNIIAVDTQAWRRAPLRGQSWRAAAAAVGTLQQAGYDTALDFQGLLKSALLARLSGARRRLGFEWGFVKESAATLFYTETVRPPADTHVVQMNLALARAAGAAESPVSFPLQTRAQEEAAVDAMLRENHLQDFFILSPGGGWGSKCWPWERYLQLHAALARRHGWRSVLNAGPGEERLVSDFMKSARVTQPVHFHLTPPQLLALVRRARLLVSGDTGPLHLAATVGTPVVGLYGPTSPVRNGPCGARAAVVHHRELAHYTYQHEDKPAAAMLAITLEEVLAAAEKVLETSSG